MPSLVNINGIIREQKSYTNINGILRESNSYVNVNGILRESSKRVVKEEDIKYFCFSYLPNRTIKHLDFPNLSYNPNIPALLSTTGENNDTWNYNFKGVEFEYDRRDVTEEGILMYECHLYAVLQDDYPIDVCCISDLNDLKIELQATLIYESNGYYIAGWNSMFSTKQFLDNKAKTEDRDFQYVNTYKILPADDREETYYPVAQIGIARDMYTKGVNMVGSYGLLDHTVHWITVNGINKPFKFEVNGR
jgi:hypothetical protein